MIVGNIESRTALRLVETWALQHEVEIRANWDKRIAKQPTRGFALLRSELPGVRWPAGAWFPAAAAETDWLRQSKLVG